MGAVAVKRKLSRRLLADLASEFGRRGGKARAKKLTPERRREIAREGGLARQAKTRSKVGR